MTSDSDRPGAALSPSASVGAGPTAGLRERKKAKTRAAIQEHALRLFQAHGYDVTTIEQIAAAAEVSSSTFFRYFPTKEDVVLFDSTDPVMFAAFAAQPPQVSVVEALRRAFHEVWSQLSEDELARERERQQLIRSVPELRARMLDDLMGAIKLLAAMVGKRVGRSPDDIAVRTFSGALIGTIMGVFLAVDDVETTDYVQIFDDAMAQLEAGLPL